MLKPVFIVYNVLIRLLISSLIGTIDVCCQDSLFANLQDFQIFYVAEHSDLGLPVCRPQSFFVIWLKFEGPPVTFWLTHRNHQVT